MTSMTPTLYEGALIHEQQTRDQVQQWIRYLRARLVLLTPMDLAADAFERDTASVQRSEAEQELVSLPSAMRTLFEQAVAQRREVQRSQLEAGQTHLADPDQVDREALHALLTEATEPDESGHILVPAQSDTGTVDWLEFRAADLAVKPNDRAYRGGRTTSPSRRQQILGGIAIVGLLLFAIARILAPDSEATSSNRSGVLLNGTATTAMIERPHSLTIEADTSATWPVQLLTDEAWPTDGEAAIRDGQLPVQACIPSDELSAIRQVTITSASALTRRYAITDPATLRHSPDVILMACSDPTIRVVGVYQADPPTPLLTIGTPQTLAEQTLTLIAVTSQGAADTPDIPQGAARIVLVFQGADIDWASRAPMLRLGDGTVQTAPAVRMRDAGLTELHFLVSAPTESLPAVVQLTDPVSFATIRWSLSIDPPRSRLAVLTEALTIHAITLQANSLLVTVQNRSTAALTLTPADVIIDGPSGRITPASILGIETALAPGEQREIRIPLPPDLRAATMQIGSYRYQLR